MLDDLWEVRRVQTGGDRSGKRRIVCYRLLFNGRFCESFLTKRNAVKRKHKARWLRKILVEEKVIK